MKSLYVHIPFCEKPCPYCSYSVRIYRKKKIPPFLKALKKEIHLLANKDVKLKSIYLGGGTPSLLSLGELESIFSWLNSSFGRDYGQEITCEINPKGVDLDYLKGLRTLGVNRLSIGLQSLSPSILSILGRNHSPLEGEKVVYFAKEAGFTSINLDLLFSVASQSIEDWQDTLEKVLLLSPEHLSLYQLQLEKGTPFFKGVKEGRITGIDEDLDYHMYKLGITLLKEKGYRHYEISNFALPGFESIHNLSYWKNDDYLGIGPGAFGHIRGERYGNHRSLKKYIAALEIGERPVSYKYKSTLKERLEDSMILGLRLLQEGVGREEIKERLGLDPFIEYQGEINHLLGMGLLRKEGERIYLTEQGLMLANLVFLEFLP